MNAFLLNKIAHMGNNASTRGAVTNVCAVMVDTEASVSTVSVFKKISELLRALPLFDGRD